jgi:hypothetical protein
VDTAEAAQRKAAAAENRRKARLPQFQALLAHAEALLAVPEAEARHLAAGRRELATGWRELGAPPEPEAEALVAARDAKLAAFDARIQAAAAAVEAEHQAMLARRAAIVVEAKALAERADLKGAGPEMGALRTRLRAAGKVPPDDPTAVGFAEAEARLRERQEQQRADRDASRKEQLERLEQLVRRAEALRGSADAEQAAERVKSLQAMWKTIKVPGPRTEVDALWTRFRAACDGVFGARTEARAKASATALERLEAIVSRVEAQVETGVDGDPEDEIGKAMAAWKKVGRAPRDAQQLLWERLQRAFDQLRSPAALELGEQDDAALQFRPFAALAPSPPPESAPPADPGADEGGR